MTIIRSHRIGGELIHNDLDPTHPVYNPATGETIAMVSLARQAIANHAIATALDAFQVWSQTPLLKRARVLFKFRDLLEKNMASLATLVTREHGKTLEDARGSILRAIEVVEHHCGLLNQLQGSFTANAATDIDCQTFSSPIGLCVGVSPFNFPVMVPVWMMIPALACGNAFILKPSEQNPSAPLRLLELLEEAGLPPGTANCLQGDKETVNYLLTHPAINAVTAVASTPVAELIYKTAIAHGKRAHTFGGAKNHAVVMPDADLSHAAHAIVGAAFGSAGERCMALSVVVTVGDDIANALINELSVQIKKITIGHGEAPDTDMGPLISGAHRQRVLAALNAGVDEGATLLIDGREYQHPEFPSGFFIGPSLVDNVTSDMSIYQNEIFGPVLVIMRVNTFEQALNLVNQHQFGNGTAIFTRDGYIARRYSQQVNAGMVGINIPIPVPIASHPFGGWKRSAFGDNGMHAFESIHFYTRLKTVTTKWPAVAETHNSFVMPVHN